MNKDAGHELTEEKIRQIEERLKTEYEQAAREVKEKLDDYLRRFEIKDKTWRRWVAEGKKTKEEYAKWRKGQILVGKRWEKLKDGIAEEMLHTNETALKIITGEMQEVFMLNANFALYQVESGGRIDTGLTLYNRETVDWIYRDDPELLLPPGRRVSEDIAAGRAKRWEKDKVQSVMMQGILQGESNPEIAIRLAEKMADGDLKAAVRNARTMSTNAQNAGRYDAYRRVEKRGVDITIEWAATLDNRTRHEHRMMHGQRRNVDEPFEVEVPGHGIVKILYPAETRGESKIPQEMVWNCFVGETSVATDSEVIRSYKHEYSGELITVKTAGGVNFTCTPNHPILTTVGWVPAAHLHKGDHLLVTRVGDDVFSGRYGDINNIHSSFKDFHRAFADLCSVEQLPVSNFNFHGDIPTSDVEVVSKQRLLREHVDARISQCVDKKILIDTDTFIARKRYFMTCFRGIYISALRIMSRRCKPASFLWRCLRHAQIHGLGTITRRNSSVFKNTINNVSAVSNVGGESFSRHPGCVFVDNIISVDRTFVSHIPVYNLQTKNGYYFVNNSVDQNGQKVNGNYAIAHNCRCTLLAYVKGYEHETIKKSKKMGDMTFEEWLHAKEEPEPILRQKEKGDAIKASYIREYREK